MTLRIGFVERFPILYLNNATGMLDGILGPLLQERLGIITKGLNLTFHVGGHSNRGCVEGSCRAIAAFIQSGKADLCSESSQMFLFDAIYKNISLSPPVLELDCRFLSYATEKPTRSFNDILTSLKVFTPSTLLFLIALMCFLFACENLPLWLYYMKRSNPGLAEMFNIQPIDDKPKSTAKPDIELPKMSGFIILLILLQFQTWYSASFQTNLVSLIQPRPVSSLSDLINRGLHAHVAKTSNCYRGLFHGKNAIDDPRVNKSMIIITTAEVSHLINKSFVDQPMVVFLGNKHEITRIKKSFSENPTVYNPKEVRKASTTILDVYMYRDDLTQEKTKLLLSRFHSVMEGDLFHDRELAINKAEEASEISAVGFQSLRMANYHYVFTIYSLCIGLITTWFISNKLIQSAFGNRKVSRSFSFSLSTKSTDRFWKEETELFNEQNTNK